MDIKEKMMKKIEGLQSELLELKLKWKEVEQNYYKVKSSESAWHVIGLLRGNAIFSNAIGDVVSVPIDIMNILFLKKPLDLDQRIDGDGNFILSDQEHNHAKLPPSFLANIQKILTEWERYWRESVSQSQLSHKT